MARRWPPRKRARLTPPASARSPTRRASRRNINCRKPISTSWTARSNNAGLRHRRPRRLDEDRAAVVIDNLLVGELEVLHAHREVAVEIVLERPLDGTVVSRPRHMGRALRDLDHLAVLHHEIAVLEHELRRSEEHTSELQSLRHLVCRLLL